MATFLEALGQVTKSVFCFNLTNIDVAARLLGRISPTAGAISQVSGGLRAQLCNGEPEPVPLPAPPFEGGQCSGTNYRVNYSFTREDGQSFTEEFASFPGPVIPEIWGVPGPGDGNAASNCANNGGTYRRWLIRSGANGQGLGLIAGCNATLNSFTLTPRSGGPNNCGDPPVIIPPPGDVIIEGDDITYEGDDGIDITVPTAFVFAPVYVDLDGSLNVPVTIDVGGVQFSGTLEIAPEFNLNIRPSGLGGGGGTPDDPGVTDGTDDPTTPPDEEEDGLPIIGVLVFSNVDENNRATQLGSDGGPDILAPRIASVQFAIRTENSVAWTSDQDVKSKEAYIPCLPPQGAVAVRVTFAPGAEGRFTAVRGRPLTTA